MAQNNNPIKYSDLISPDNSITQLIEQLDNLGKTYSKALSNIKEQAIDLAAVTRNVSGATEAGREATKKAATEADKLARAQRDLAFAESENAKKLAELKQATKEQNDINKLVIKRNQSAEGSYNRLSAQYSLNKIYLNNMTKAERENTAEGRKLEEQTRAIYEEMKRLQEATGKFQLNVGNYTQASDAIIAYGDNVKGALGLNNQFGESLLALGRGGEESKAVFTAMSDGAKALGKTLLGLLSNPVFLAIAGIAGAGVVFKWWYDYNAGLVEATRLTQQFTGKGGDDLKAYRNQVQAVSDTFNADFKETLIASNALAKQFGISADEALKLIQDGFVAGGNANGEFLDSLKEYPAYFKEAGISADQFVAILAQTNKAGIFSDKGVDAIKEGNLRLREMTTATAAALDGIGISSEKVQQDLQSGAKTTFQVMQEVSAKLAELPESSSQVGTAIADIFGGPGEDAGLQYLKTLKDIETNLSVVKEETGILGKLQEEQLQSQIELENALSGLFDLTGGNFEALTTSIKVFANNALASVIKGVISLINYFVEFYNNSLALRVLWNSLVSNFKTGIDVVGNLFNYLVDVIKATGRTLKGVFTLDWDELKGGIKDFGEALPRLIKTSVKDAANNFSEGLDAMNKKVKPITIPVSVGNEKASNTIQSASKNRATPKSATNDKSSAKAIESAYKNNLSITRRYEDELLKLETNVWKRRKQQIIYQYSRQIEDLRHQLATESNLSIEARRTLNDTINVLEQQQTQELEKLQSERNLRELQQVKDGIALRLAAVKKGSEQERKLKTEQIEIDRKIALLQNAQKPVGEQQATSDINAGFDARIADQYMASELQIFDQQQALAQSEFDLFKKTELQKKEFAIKAHRDRLLKIIEINKELGGQLLGDNEVSTLNNQIAAANAQIDNLYSEDRREKISEFYNIAIDALSQYADAVTAAADRQLEQADRRVDAAQKVLDAELEARANGYANNVAMAQKELDLARKNQQKALKEQEKAQKQQATIQTIQQIGNMVTATSLIWSQLGFPFAIPAIAVMWASFAASKIKAAQLAKQSGGENTEKYGDGTVELLEGGSHQSGNDVDLGTKPDGTRRRAEGGEFFAVINKRSSRRYRQIIPDVINSLNAGTFSQKYSKAYAGADGLTLNVKEETPDLQNLTDDVREIKEQNRRRIYTDGDGKTVVVYKNLKRKIN